MIGLASVLSGQLSVQTGTVAGFGDGGLIYVQTGTLDAPLRAYFLRTSDAEPPHFSAGDAVLIAVDSDEAVGYVLGAISSYSHDSNPGNAQEQDPQAREDSLPGSSPKSRRDSAGISLPRTPSDVMRLKAGKIHLEAGEEIELTCGGGSIRIDKRGKIVVRGTDVVSRARRSNKIKGGTVAIN